VNVRSSNRLQFWAKVAGLAVVALLALRFLDQKRAEQFQAAAIAEAKAQIARAEERGWLPGGRRQVDVRVIDKAGEPVRGARVFAPARDGKPLLGREFEPGRHTLAGLSAGSAEIVVELAGDRYHLRHATSKTSATLVVPIGGRMSVEWALPSTLDLAKGRVVLVLEPQRAPEDRFEVPVAVAEGNRGSVELAYLLPGRYRAQLEHWRDADATSGKAVVLPLTTPLPVTVEERKLTRISLGLTAR
jgi:hypothetical protein